MQLILEFTDIACADLGPETDLNRLRTTGMFDGYFAQLTRSGFFGPTKSPFLNAVGEDRDKHFSTQGPAWHPIE